jgi:Tol biopolymer transport system component
MVNDGMSQHDPELSDDGLRMYYAPNPGGGQRVHLATRATRGDPFGPGAELAALTPAITVDPTLSPDELVLVYAGTPDVGTTPVDLYYATRSSTALEFTNPMPLTALNTTTQDADPALSADGCELVFASNRGAGGDRDIYIVDVQ